MKKLCVVAVMVLVCASAAFGDVNNELFVAAMEENTTPQMIKDLIKSGANVNAKTDNGETALMWAVRHRNAEVVKALIEAGADINAKNNKGATALMLALILNRSPAKTVQILIDSGADIFAKDNAGKTALYYAKNDEIKKVILNSAQ